MRIRSVEVAEIARGVRRDRASLTVLAFVALAVCVASAATLSCTGGGNPGSSTSSTSSAGADSADSRADLASPAQDVLNAVYSSVVNIAVSGIVGGQTAKGIGSGIVYTSDGLILTNDHVVTLDGQLTSGQAITVTFSSGEAADAKIVGRDANKDLAALKVDRTGLNPVIFATSSEVLLAEWATVIGSPLDFRNSVTLGIVSGLDRSLPTGPGQPTLTGLIQIDAAISPGNSGGGCFDTRGRFIGMPEVYISPGQTGAENVAFAIPSDVVAAVAKTLTGR